MSSSGDAILCPVKARAAIFQWLWLILGTTRDTPANKVNITGVPFGITSDLILGPSMQWWMISTWEFWDTQKMKSKPTACIPAVQSPCTLPVSLFI